MNHRKLVSALLKALLYLWSGINETIRFANRKQEYLKMRLDMKIADYTEYGLENALKTGNSLTK